MHSIDGLGSGSWASVTNETPSCESGDSMNDFSLNEAASSAARISTRKPARHARNDRRRSAITRPSGSIIVVDGQAASRRDDPPSVRMMFPIWAPTLRRVAGIPGFLPETSLDLPCSYRRSADRPQAGRTPNSLSGRCNVPPVDSCGFTLCPIVTKFRRFLRRQQFAHPPKPGAIGGRHRSLQWSPPSG